MLYVDSEFQNLLSEYVSANTRPGEVIYLDPANGGLARPALGSDPRVDGIAAAPRSEAWTAWDDDDFRADYADFVYKPQANYSETTADPATDPMPFGDYTDGAKARLWTPNDQGDTTLFPAPNIGRWDVVGVPDITEYEGRIVEEGYTADPDNDGVNTTYSRANGNFVPVGLAIAAADNVPQTNFESLVHVVARKDL